MKETSVKYCQVCSKDFAGGDIVYYVPIDNNIVCPKCAVEANTEVRERFVTVATNGNDIKREGEYLE